LKTNFKVGLSLLHTLIVHAQSVIKLGCGRGDSPSFEVNQFSVLVQMCDVSPGG